jgi:pimeloyl-ACP methyl ester carboxylesterase
MLKHIPIDVKRSILLVAAVWVALVPLVEAAQAARSANAANLPAWQIEEQMGAPSRPINGPGAPVTQLPEKPRSRGIDFVCDEECLVTVEGCSPIDAEADINITRYLGPVTRTNASLQVDLADFNTMRLRNAGQMIRAGVLKPMARVRLGISGRVPPSAAPIPPPSSLTGVLNTTCLFNFALVPGQAFTQGATSWTAQYEGDVPIEELRFPWRKGGPFAQYDASELPPGSPKEVSGTPPPKVVNRFEVGVPAGLCLTVSAARIKIQAASPVVLLHGIQGEGPPTFNRFEFARGLEENFLLVDYSITQAPEADTPERNATRLATGQLPRPSFYTWEVRSIPQIAAEHGTDFVHLVCHSQGGLDARFWLENEWLPPVEPVSLITLATPHDGSVLGDHIWEDIQSKKLDRTPWMFTVGHPSWTLAPLTRLAILSNLVRAVRRDGSDAEGWEWLQTDVFNTQFAPGNMAALQRLQTRMLFATISADASRYSNNQLQELIEAEGFLPDWLANYGYLLPYIAAGSTILGLVCAQPWALLVGRAIFAANDALIYQINDVYQTVGWTQRMAFTRRIGPLGVPYYEATSPVRAVFEENDIIVARESARGSRSFQALTNSTTREHLSGSWFANHSTINRRSVANSPVTDWIIKADMQYGGLR